MVTFVKRYYNLDFNEAVEKLADEYGIEIQKNSHKDDREKYYEVNREAARLFYRNLTEKKNPGYTYMQRRGIQAVSYTHLLRGIRGVLRQNQAQT